MYLDKLEASKNELEEYKVAARENEKHIQGDVKAANNEKIELIKYHEEQLSKANEELNEVREARDSLIQQKNKLEGIQDEQKAEIDKLQQDYHRAKEDVECRKLIIDEMNNNMLHHEREERELAQKLTLMKNQIMESDASNGMNKRYAAVRLGTIRHHPCTILFVEGVSNAENEEDAGFYMVIDGRHETITIDCNNIDQFSEIEENGRLILVYHLPAESSRFSRYAEGEMVRRSDQFECAENEDILKTFMGIRNKMMGIGGDAAFAGH